MPLYEYECQKCQKVHEIMQKFSDAPLADCPECKSPVKKIMSLSAFSLKGTGWYSTDYKKSSGGKSASAPSSAETATTGASNSGNSSQAAASSDTSTPAVSSKPA